MFSPVYLAVQYHPTRERDIRGLPVPGMGYRHWLDAWSGLYCPSTPDRYQSLQPRKVWNIHAGNYLHTLIIICTKKEPSVLAAFNNQFRRGSCIHIFMIYSQEY